ncbi:MAG: HD domain-containing protein [Nitrospirae bacterium]|nr:HD domain-containing protein [Nitrospirota bacterium]
MVTKSVQLIPALKLEYPVYNLDDQLLLPAGTELTPDTLDYIASLNRSGPPLNYSLLSYIKGDLLKFLRQPPYDVIFDRRKDLPLILDLFKKVPVAVPVLRSLEFFKINEPYTYRHILTTFALTTFIAKDLISDYQDLMMEVASCPAHDIGKISVPLHILKKPAALTLPELKILKHHTIAGYVLLSYYLNDTRNLSAIIAKDHHERRDGSGYPLGKSLSDRMVEIVAVSDTYDALVSHRPYRKTPYDNRSALEILTQMAERKEIGWDVVKALVSYNRKDRPSFSDCMVSTEKRGSHPEGNMYGTIADENEQHS